MSWGKRVVAKTLPGLAIIFLVTLLYSPGLNYPFFFDDYNSLMNDQGLVSEHLKNPGQALKNLLNQPLRPDRNLTWLSFAASYQQSRMNPSGFRAVNLILHGLSSFLLYYLLALLLAKHNLPKPNKPHNSQICWPALIGALFFLCHPLALNTVLYISQRFGAQASLFYLLGFYAWLKGTQKRTETTGKRESFIWFSLTALAFWGAIHSKEMALTLPLTIIAYELYMCKPQPGNRKKVFLLCGLILLAVTIFFLFAWQIGLFNRSWINIGFYSKRLWSPAIQFSSEARAFFNYWQMLILPLPRTLSLHHEFSPSPGLDPAAIFAIIGHTCLIVTAWKIRLQYPLIGFGILWFYLVLGPPYLFLPQRELLVEYKTYLATPGIALILCGLVRVIKNRLANPKKTMKRLIIYLSFGCWIFILASITWQRRPVFQSPITLWSDVLQKYPSSRRALNNRAVAHLKNRAPQKALKDLNTLVKNHPNYARGFENRGRLRLYLKDYQGAAEDLQSTLRLLPDEPQLKNSINQITKLKKRAQQAAQKEKRQ